MAEFCLDCFNKLEGTDYYEDEVTLGYDDLDLCEGCGQIRPCVVELRPPSLWYRWKTRKERKKWTETNRLQ